MLDKNLYNFYLSYRLNGVINLEWIEGINLRHAKDKILFKNPEATDLMDWTNERKEDLDAYIKKVNPQEEKTKKTPKKD